MLEITDLVVSYGAIGALRGVSLTVARGETVAIVGANGAGKSSLLNTIMGVVPAASGSIRFEGTELVGMRAHRIARRGLRSVPEGGAAFAGMTVYENLQLGLTAQTPASALDEVYERFPKLSQRSRQLAGTLSGGERQMLAIARATLGRPEMLLLDEPSFGLAPVIVDEVFAMIETLTASGLTVLLVEQNARRALGVSSRAYVLEQGAVVASGASATLLEDDAVVEAYLGMA